MRTMIRLAMLATLAVLALGPAPTTAGAQASIRCFPETDLCAGGAILRYWERSGGLAVFGYPISEQRIETVEGRTLTLQWFERDRLEIQADGTVTAGRLGARVLEIQGRPWDMRPREEEWNTPRDGCRYFRETGRYLCGAFLRYWEGNGGVERLGYPISEHRQEEVEGELYLVQYFERRRVEYHPENAGTPYEFLLGLLGRELLEVQGLPPCQGALPNVPADLEDRITSVFFRSDLECPTAPRYNVPAAVQSFEWGSMIWVDLGAAGRKIYVYRSGAPHGATPSYLVYDDTYSPADPPVSATPPGSPPGLQVPQRGFGKVWAAGERQLLGYATDSERPTRATVQLFALGGAAIRLQEQDRVWVFGPSLGQIQTS